MQGKGECAPGGDPGGGEAVDRRSCGLCQCITPMIVGIASDLLKAEQTPSNTDGYKATGEAALSSIQCVPDGFPNQEARGKVFSGGHRQAAGVDRVVNFGGQWPTFGFSPFHLRSPTVNRC